MATMHDHDATSPGLEETTTCHEVNELPAPRRKRTPLPKFQLFIVFLIQFAEPITASVIYPFINQFVRDTGVTGGDQRKTGYYAGIIVSDDRDSFISTSQHLVVGIFVLLRRGSDCLSLGPGVRLYGTETSPFDRSHRSCDWHG